METNCAQIASGCDHIMSILTVPNMAPEEKAALTHCANIHLNEWDDDRHMTPFGAVLTSYTGADKLDVIRSLIDLGAKVNYNHHGSFATALSLYINTSQRVATRWDVFIYKDRAVANDP